MARGKSFRTDAFSHATAGRFRFFPVKRTAPPQLSAWRCRAPLPVATPQLSCSTERADRVVRPYTLAPTLFVGADAHAAQQVPLGTSARDPRPRPVIARALCARGNPYSKNQRAICRSINGMFFLLKAPHFEFGGVSRHLPKPPFRRLWRDLIIAKIGRTLYFYRGNFQRRATAPRGKLWGHSPSDRQRPPPHRFREARTAKSCTRHIAPRDS